MEPFINQMRRAVREALTRENISLECEDALAAIVTAVANIERDMKTGNKKYIQSACIGIAALAYFVHAGVDKHDL